MALRAPRSLRIRWESKDGEPVLSRLSQFEYAMDKLRKSGRNLPKHVFLSDAKTFVVGARVALNTIKDREPALDWNHLVPRYFGKDKTLSLTAGQTTPWYVDCKEIEDVCIREGDVLYLPIYRGMDITFINLESYKDFHYINIDDPFNTDKKVEFIWTGWKLHNVNCAKWIDAKYIDCTITYDKPQPPPVSTASATSSQSSESPSKAETSS